MSDAAPTIDGAEAERHATNLELFLDLVFVFAVTQIASMISLHPSAGGTARAFVVALPVVALLAACHPGAQAGADWTSLSPATPPHYTAGSSVYDMFSFDQPIITMEGELAVSRVTAAYYRKMGIGELIAPSAEAYVRLAVAVAGDRDYRMNLRERIHLAGGAIFDDLEAVREHERFFHEVLA